MYILPESLVISCRIPKKFPHVNYIYILINMLCMRLIFHSKLTCRVGAWMNTFGITFLLQEHIFLVYVFASLV